MYGSLGSTSHYFSLYLLDFFLFLKATVMEDGSYTLAKHFSMGRTSVELPFVMPDNRTVYIMDDGTNRVMTVYKADIPGDLSSGTLYASKVIH